MNFLFLWNKYAMDQLTNTNKDPLYIPNKSIIKSKMKALKEVLNRLILQVSAKKEIKDLVEHQE